MPASRVPLLGSGPNLEGLALVIAWSLFEPGRIGEVAFVTEGDRTQIIGRGDGFNSEYPRTVWNRQRPGALLPMPPLAEPGISREQLRLRARADGIEMERLGRCQVLVNGQPAERALIEAGDTIHLKGQLLLYCTRRKRDMRGLRSFPAEAIGPFAEPDSVGLVGESPLMWKLREGIAHVALSERHTLIVGETGTERDAVVAAVHALSPRSNEPLEVFRAGQTRIEVIEQTLRRRTPPPGQGGFATVVLEEIGDLDAHGVARLVRALERKSGSGTHQALRKSPGGTLQMRPPPMRLLATTGRDPYELPAELLQRLTPALLVPTLNQRREDIPILAYQLVMRAAQRTPTIAERFFEVGVPRIDPALLDRLLHHSYELHLRELGKLLERAIAWSTGDWITLTPEVEHDIVENSTELAQLVLEPISRGAVIACIHRHDGNLTAAARELGLPSRFALYRLLKKHNIEIREAREG